MPQIGWFEILVIVILSVLIIGPKDFPIVLKKIGGWIGSVKSYINKIQSSVTDLEDDIIKDNETSNQEKKSENNRLKIRIKWQIGRLRRWAKISTFKLMLSSLIICLLFRSF